MSENTKSPEGLTPPSSTKPAKKYASNTTWKVLIVDDEPDMHVLTQMVAGKNTFLGKKLEFVSAYSGEEAKVLIAEHSDTALVLLDIVMETGGAGLEVARYIREDLQNHFVRIIIRTGQPGMAPESRVVLDYDINDYREKTELSAQKFISVLTTAFRSYRDIMIIETNRQALEKIIKSSPTIMQLKSLNQFASSCLTQLTSILSIDTSVLYCQAEGFAAEKANEHFYILAGTGIYEDMVEQKVNEAIPPHILKDFEQVIQQRKSLYANNHYVGYFESPTGSINVVYVEGWESLGGIGRKMIEMFCDNISLAYDNICHKQDILETQTELLSALGQAAETRNSIKGNHIKRVAAYSQLIAQYYGLSEHETEILCLASMLHDIGHIQIPTQILDKKDALTEQEQEIVKKHPLMAQEIFAHSDKELIQAAKIIASQHQEKYDGTGYPAGLKGDDLHIYAQITALADVFDSLSCKKPYRNAWELDRILEFIKQQKGKHFNPDLVDILLKNLDNFLQIKTQYPDPPLDE